MKHLLAYSCAVSMVAMLGISARAQVQYFHPPEVESVRHVHSEAPQAMVVNSLSANNTLHIPVGQSTLLHSEARIRRMYIGNPAILQSFAASPEQVVVTAKAAGLTSLVLWDTLGHTRMYTVSADIDPTELRNALDSEFPGNNIHLTANQDLITLTGSVPTKEMSDAAAKLAGVYAKQVANSLRIDPVHGKQVQLKLQILEIDRSKLQQFGVNIFKPMGNTVGGITTGQFPSTLTTTTGALQTVTASNPLNLFLYNFKLNAGVTVQDLEQKNVLQILAEPTLTTMSGEEAHFLSGGEFPFPMVQGGTGNSTAISIEFRPYGVKMDFTPVVNSDGTINLKVVPEVSTLDYTNAVTISGYTIPAISTRRAETDVELRNGETFALSGLLDHRTTEVMSKIPGIGDLPILGPLFRSKSQQRSVLELVVLVTASVVDPLATPPPPVHRPTWVVPNMHEKNFDNDVHKEWPRDVSPQGQVTSTEP